MLNYLIVIFTQE